MAKRYTDCDIWKRQRWFRELPSEYKLAMFYIKDNCDNCGVWKIDCADLIYETGIAEFELQRFIHFCNKDTDKLTGKPIQKVRFKLINERELWLTVYVQFQYENRDTGKVSETHVIGKNAIKSLKNKGLYQEAIKCKYLFVSQ